MSKIKLIDPKVAISKTRENNSTIFPLLKLLPRITESNDELLQNIDDEWRLVNNFNIPTDVLNHLEEPDVFWFKLSNLQMGNQEYPFLHLSNFALGALSLPHSNTDCERIFSKVNLIKVKTRNRLNTDTIQGCLLASQQIKIKNDTCINFKPSNKMIDSMTTSNLYDKNSNDEFCF